jgi:hypothetical protein
LPIVRLFGCKHSKLQIVRLFEEEEEEEEEDEKEEEEDLQRLSFYSSNKKENPLLRSPVVKLLQFSAVCLCVNNCFLINNINKTKGRSPLTDAQMKSVTMIVCSNILPGLTKQKNPSPSTKIMSSTQVIYSLGNVRLDHFLI